MFLNFNVIIDPALEMHFVHFKQSIAVAKGIALNGLQFLRKVYSLIKLIVKSTTTITSGKKFSLKITMVQQLHQSGEVSELMAQLPFII